MTSAATGASLNPQPAHATREAVAQALSTLAGTPRLGWLFSSPKHDLATVIQAARESAPGCEFFAAHTAGEFTERGAMRGGVVAFLLASDTLMFQTAVATGLTADPEGASQTLARGFAPMAEQASLRGLGLSTTVVLLDGLTIVGEQVVQGLRAGTRLFQQIVGGAAGDDGQFKATPVAAGSHVGVDSAVAVHVFDRRPWGVGVEHGLRPATRRMTVTKGAGAVVAELDRKPAFEVYQAFAQSRGVELTQANAGAFFIAHELGVYYLDAVHQARAPVGVGHDGQLHLIANLTKGASVCILDSEPQAMIDACGKAAQQARTNVGEGPVAGVLVFDCLCRGMILAREFQKEIEAVRAVFPNVPVAGFLGYGEIARFRSRSEGWHNAASVVVAIPA